jgi:molybdopterin/thiamine biosynthesis adenylyltransferase
MNKRVRELEANGVIDNTRHRDWYDPMQREDTLTVIGAGGIGSLFSVLAGKLGINKIILYDEDLVDKHNLPNQFYPLDSFGYYKSDALGETIERFSISEVESIKCKVDETSKLRGLVVSGVDSMEARKEIAEAVRRNRFTVDHYWDARIGGEKLVIYSVNPKDPGEWDAYIKTLYSDEDAEEAPCTRRSVIDVMGHVGSFLLTSVREYLSGKKPDGFTYVNVEEKQIFNGTIYAAVGETVGS